MFRPTLFSRAPRRAAMALALAVGLLLAVVGTTPPASAAACTSPVRFAASSNTLYLVADRDYTLTDIKASCSAAPLALVDAASRTWLLSANLIVQNGARLVLHGNGAEEPGDVNVLRIRSRSSNLKTEVNELTADYGDIDIDSVLVTSWDDIAGIADSNPSLPSGSLSTNRGRAFVRVRSHLESGSIPRVSRLDIRNSTLENLGYNYAESYGVSYKASGCDRTPALYPNCDLFTVTGSQINSTFRNNYIGTYTWGAQGMTFQGNTYQGNKSYGLDPHDVSRDLLVTGNHFVGNGNHGFICSQLCDNLTITGNVAEDNGVGSIDQIHGFMIHRGVTNTLIANNVSRHNPTGAGIAIFDSSGNVVRDNVIESNKYGIRLSVGASDNHFQDNDVRASSQYAVYMFKGSDEPAYSSTNGHPTANTFNGNTYDGTGSNAVKLSQGDRNVFTGDTFLNTGGSVYSDSGVDNEFVANDFPKWQILSVQGSPGRLTLTEPTKAFKVSAAVGNTITVRDSGGMLYDYGSRTIPAALSPSGSSVVLNSTLLGTTSSFQIQTPATRVLLATGTAQGRITTGSTGHLVTLVTDAAVTAASIQVGGLVAGASYRIERNGAVIATGLVADAAGTVTYDDPAVPTSNTVAYKPVKS